MEQTMMKNIQERFISFGNRNEMGLLADIFFQVKGGLAAARQTAGNRKGEQLI